ncbi:FAD-dependent monooxygenase [Hydrogenophaga defluvii]|uniref:FAD-dependent monooxygenase n=1 Tax=Hydrogenophaga defluvii TaxID=249410 RepID=A0ABW2SEC0_9BURK
MSRKFDVCVRGGGVVGHALALLLARDRLRVALVRPPAPAGALTDVRAYALNAASRALLQDLRVWPDPASATPVAAMQICEDGGNAPPHAAVRFDSPGADGDALAWIVDVPAFEQRLREAVGFQSGIEVLDSAEGLTPSLTVICEGKRSSSRAQFGFEFDTRPYPHTAVAARLRCALPHGGVARQWFVQGDIMAWLPLDGPQGHRVALVWSVAHERAAQLLALAPDALAAEVQANGHAALGAMALDGAAAGWPLELSRARRWVACHGDMGVALAGDAAHAMHPLAGQGLNVGLGDVAELAHLLHQRESWREPGDMRLLRRYERARQADVRAMGAVTEGLYSLFAHSDSRLQALRRWGLQRFDSSSTLKQWVVRQAAGHTPLRAGH